MMTLRQLRYLAALAKHRHFGRAAEECAVSQPALSMQIRQLEKLLGANLVERRPGEVLLTDLGQQIADRGESMLAAARDIIDLARHGREQLSGRLVLGAIPSIAPYVLPRLLPLLQQRYPKLRVELRETRTKTLLDELARGSIDVVLLALPLPDEADVDILPLFDDPFLLAVPTGDAAHYPDRVTAEDIDLQRLILLEDGHCLRDQALAYCTDSRRSGALGLGATSLTTVMQMVANGHGITLVPEVAVDVEVRDTRVRLLRFAAPQPGRTVGLAWRKTSPRRAEFTALGELVKEAPASSDDMRPPAR